ncbi:MAG TPA: cytochrome c family protein [Geminicoccaceae bacterium]|nr:cytochrome c family protein [Geminicoccaceae bacterium]
MATLEFNKTMAAILTAGVVASGAGVLSRMLYQPHAPEEPAYRVAVSTEGTEAGAAEAPADGVEPIAPLLAAASVEAGQAASRACTACHAFEQGGPSRVGPPLWDVVGRDIAGAEGFSYSSALQGMEGVWDYEALNGFLHGPREWAPGTKMSFAGIRGAEDRANMIAYLRSLSDDPEPLPSPEEVAAATEAAGQAAAGATAAEGAAEAPGAAAEAGAAPIGPMIAAASVEEGEAAVRACAACPTVDQGGANRIGPNLWGVVGRDIAGLEGFSYSSALQGMEGAWDYENLAAFLHDPRGWAPGTKMAFAGLTRPEQVAAVIAYLRSLSENPAPLPEGG